MAHGPYYDTLVTLGIGMALLYLVAQLATRLKFSTIPLFMIAGLLLREIIDETQARIVDVFAALGIVLVMFAVRLEFSPRAFLGRWRQLLRGGMVDLALNLPLGFLVGLAFGFGIVESLFIGVAFYPTSTAITSRTLMQLGRLANAETEHALNVLVFEDLAVAILLVALLAASAGGGGGELPLLTVLGQALKTLGFAAVTLLIGFFGTRVLQWILRGESGEIFLLGILAHATIVSAAALQFGLSEAVGAMLAGMMIAESTLKERAIEEIAPLEHAFGAVFFLGFGLAIDWRSFGANWPLALSLLALGIGTKLLTGRVVGRLSGLKPRSQWRLGFALVPRGEFSLIVAGIAAAALPNTGGAVRDAMRLFVLAMSITGVLTMMYGERLLPKAKPAVRTVAKSAVGERVTLEFRKPDL